MKRSLLTVLIVCSLLFCALTSRVATTVSGASNPQDDTKPSKLEFVPGNVLVRFRPNTELAANASIKSKRMTLRALGGREIPVEIQEPEGLSVVKGLRLARVAPEDTLEAIDALKRRPDVLYAEPDFVRRKDSAPNDPRYSEQWSLKNTGQTGGAPGADVHAEAAWDVTTGSRSVVVGIVDEGMDITHPDLQANVWTNPAEIAGNGVDDDGNGFVDDVHGWDFFHNDASVYDGHAAFPTDETDAHGTHVAGTVGASGNNSLGVVGVNWQVSLMSLKVLGAGPEQPAPSSVSTTIRAYNYARMMRDLWVSSGGTKGANIRVLNNSYGGEGRSQAEQDAIHALAESQILFVAAAGNSGRNSDIFPEFPASYDEPNMISVAATDDHDFITSFSNYGPRSVHMAAPGGNVLSTTPGGTYTEASGTSMAAPHVSGAAALACAANPNISLARLRAALIYGGDFVPSLTPTIFPPGVMTGRRLNVANTVASAVEADSTAPNAVGNFRITSQDGRGITLSWTAPGDDGATGRASLYELRFSDTDLSAPAQFIQARNLVAPLPEASGTSQSFTVKIPFRHPAGFIGIRAVDNVGNEGPISSVNVTLALSVGDPYTITESAAEPLSTGGTPLGLNGDDKFRADFSLPFMFPLFEGSTNTLSVSTNGKLYFTNPLPRTESGDAADFFSTREGLVQYKAIAGLWDDLRTDRRPGDDVYVVQPDNNTIIFRWQAVTYDTPLGPNQTRGEHPVNFEIELHRDGTIKVRYGDGNQSLFPVAGISAGEPDTYIVDSHTSETSLINLTNAPTITYALRSPPRLLSNLIVHMQGAPNPVQTGQQITYSIDYVSHGPDFDRDVVITDEIPAGATFVSCSGTCEGPPVGSGGTIKLHPGNAAFFTVVPFTVVLKATAPAGSKITNTISVAGSVTEDPDTSDNTASVTTDVFADSVFGAVKAIGAGSHHTLAVKTDGSVWGWGSNNSLEAVYAPVSVVSTPLQVAGVTNGASVAAGESHTVLLKKDGTVWTWGANSFGQLGREENLGTLGIKPAQVAGLSNVTAVAAAGNFSMALLSDGTVRAWGDNSSGQLGDDTFINRNAPVAVSGLTNVIAIDASAGGFAMALKSDGTVWAWGDNRSGALGDGTNTSRRTPVQVNGLTNVKAIAACGSSGFWLSVGLGVALKTDGTVWSWGGPIGSTSPPSQVAGISNVSALDAGGGHVLALKSDGTVWTWGANFDGQFGDGTNGQFNNTPRQVSDIANVTAVAAGGSHSVALLADGTVRTWGDNTFKQLGDGTGLDRNRPVQVSGVLAAAPPIIDPGGGYFTGALDVRLTSGTEGAVIHYTTNGQEPTESDPSILSGSTFRLTQSCTLKAKAFKPGYVTSSYSEALFTIANPIDNGDFFVRQQYLDFLNREPDLLGQQFWSSQISSCGFNPQCIEVKRIHVSAAFFLSIEFQETGYLVYRAHKAAFGNLPGKPVPLTREEMLPEMQQIGAGLIVGEGDWQTKLEQNKRAYFDALASSARFTSLYTQALTPEQFVDALNTNAGGALSTAERDALVADLKSNAKTRAQVLRAVSEDADLNRAETNRAFVLMQYYGYMRRNPDDLPDHDFAGWQFWLDKLNQFNGDFVKAEMVKAFINSDEYRHRFGQ